MLKSLSISNFENMIGQIGNVLIPEPNLLSGWSLVFFFLSLGLFGFAFYLSFRLKGTLRKVLIIVISILFIRFIALGNPFAWNLYSKVLTVQDIGWRQHSVIKDELSTYGSKTERTDYLAVGSSQTEAIYRRYSQQNPGLRIFSLAGLSPLDYILYQNRILSFSPQCILLYLSELDMTKYPDFSASRFAPRQGFSLFNCARPIHLWKGSNDGKEFLTEMIVGEIFPEYKYAFIFQGITRKIKSKFIGTSYAAPGTNLEPGDYLTVQVKGLKRDLGHGTDFHFAYLDKFLRICGQKNISVVIVEGQYHPAAYTEKNKKLNRIVKTKLAGLSARYQHVRFLPRENTFQLNAAHYKDGYHVKPEAGLVFASHLMSGFPDVTPDLPPAYEYGTDIFFRKRGNGRLYSNDGWSDPEGDHTWTDGESATLQMTIRPSSGDLIMTTDIIPLLIPDKLKEQRVFISINGRKKGEWIVTAAGEYRLKITREDLQGPALKIRFDLPDATCPALSGYNEDQRILGVAVRKIVLNENKQKAAGDTLDIILSQE